MLQNQNNKLVEEIYEACIEYLHEMVSIYSVSMHEGKLADYIAAELQAMGVSAFVDSVGEEGANIEAILQGSEAGPVIGLAGHLDTVPIVEGWETDPLVLTEKEGRLYGLGSCDMKAGNAMILAFAKVLTRHGISFSGSLKLLFVCDEEGYSSGAKQMLQKNISAESVYMTEANFEKAIVGAVGKALIQITLKGKACHAAWPGEGINAVEEGARLLAALPQISPQAHERLDAQPFVTLSMKGGYDTYSLTVPELCTIRINKHLVPGESADKLLEQLRQLAESLKLRSEVEMEILQPYYGPYELSEDCSAVRDLADAYTKVMGRKLETEYGEGVSDANCFYDLGGINTVNFGPLGGNMHCANEWVEKDSIKKTIEIYLELLTSKMSWKEREEHENERTL